jgi:hypothetical protein
MPLGSAVKYNDTTPVALKRVLQASSDDPRTFSSDSADAAIASIQLSDPHQSKSYKSLSSQPAVVSNSNTAGIAAKLSGYLLPLLGGSSKNHESQPYELPPPSTAAMHGQRAYVVHDMNEKQQPLAPAKLQQQAKDDRMSIDTVSLSHGATQSTSSTFSVMSAQGLAQLCSPSTSNDSETTAAVVFPSQQQSVKAAPQQTPLKPRSNLQLLSLAPTVPPRMQRQQWCLDDYTVLEKLYTGYASTVYKAVCRRSAETVVLKVYHLTSVCELYR